MNFYSLFDVSEHPFQMIKEPLKNHLFRKFYSRVFYFLVERVANYSAAAQPPSFVAQITQALRPCVICQLKMRCIF